MSYIRSIYVLCLRGQVFLFYLIWFEDTSNWKVAIVKQEMMDWPNNHEKTTPGRNFKLSFYNSPWNTDIDFQFQFSVIWEVWLHGNYICSVLKSFNNYHISLMCLKFGFVITVLSFTWSVIKQIGESHSDKS